MKYTRAQDQFSKTLRGRVDAYFERTGQSRKGNAEAWVKVALALFLAWGPYFWLLLGDLAGWQRVALAFVVGIGQISLVLQIGHDASHGALFESKALNWIFARAFNMGGSDAWAWHVAHDKIHHIFPNVAGTDGDIQRPAPFLRMSPSVPWRPWHRYQRYYAPLLYMQMTLFGVTLRDFKDLRLLPNKNAVEGMKVDMPWHAVPLMLTSKAVYYGYALVLPTLVLQVPFWKVLLVWVCVHWMMGLVLAAGLLPAHMSSHTIILPVPEGGVIPTDHVRHAFSTVVDYGVDNRLFTAFYGGLNIHVLHHLLPGICHVHLPHLMPILRETAREFGIAHTELGIAEAIGAHFAALQRNGDPDWHGTMPELSPAK